MSKEYTDSELREKFERSRAKQRERSKRHYEQHKDKLRREKLERYHRSKVKKEDEKESLREANKEYHKNYHTINKDKIKLQRKSYYENNKDKFKSRHKSYYENNKEHIKSKTKKYFKLNKNKIYKHRNNRSKNDIQYKLSNNLRKRIISALKNNQKVGSAVSDLGCSIDELKIYLESKFQPGMSWDNWSKDGWHIDHIKPLASFDLTDKKQMLEACHYTNLQPLWAKDNLSKSDKTTQNSYHDN